MVSIEQSVHAMMAETSLPSGRAVTWLRPAFWISKIDVHWLIGRKALLRIVVGV